VVGDNVTNDALMAAVRGAAAGLVRSAILFDIYKPTEPHAGIAAGERSLAIRLELLDDEATLVDDRIEAAVAAVVESARAACGARLRS
jgi:phenylalanyl-tRNA synthetase beta chain